MVVIVVLTLAIVIAVVALLGLLAVEFGADSRDGDDWVLH
jgi:hypothetical protein